jgi:RNA polymerase sigma-70 factor (ECF subfamily)
MSDSSPPLGQVEPGPARTEEVRLVAALQQGDETAFASLVERYHLSLLRLATAYVSDRMVAEEVVQETWLALVRGIDRFEGRSSLKTWLFRVLTYQARRRATHEGRIVSFSEMEWPAVAADRFRADGHWADGLPDWSDTPEQQLLSHETRELVESLIARLSPRQRTVIVLRDIEGLSAAEICEILAMTDSTERMLLHRARSHVRQGLEQYLRGTEEA